MEYLLRLLRGQLKIIRGNSIKKYLKYNFLGVVLIAENDISSVDQLEMVHYSTVNYSTLHMNRFFHL